MSHVLIVDDKQDNRYLLRVMLRAEGFEVDEALHGAEALEKARQNPPQLIISDLLMPIMDGYTLLRRWKADEQLSKIPFIVYTATYTESKDQRLAYDLGADAFLLKPTEPDVILACVKEVLEKSISGALKTRPPLISDEHEILQQYSEVLVRKLEEKALLLERSNASLQRKIDEFEQARSNLYHTSELLNAVTESTTDAIFVKDRDGRYLLCNPAAAHFMGREPAEIIGHTDADFFDAASAATVQENDLRVLNTGEAQTQEEVLTAAGTTRTYLATKAPYRNERGETIGLIGISRDITERKRLEVQLRHAQKMEAIGRLAGGVAHDFNNLLSVIIGYADFVLGEINEEDPAHQDVRQIRLAADKATALTRQLLVFSRKQIMRPEVISINRVIGESEKLLQRLIGEDVEFSFIPEDNLGLTRVDASQIEQVILNLSVNARDAMPRGGRLTVKTANVEIQGDYLAHSTEVPAGRYIQLNVADTGIGMDSDTRTRIFEPFFTTKGPGAGTGLGLATVYGIIEQSGGYISVYSEPGMGTTFKILLPRVDEEPARPSVEPETGAALGTETILLVEDDAALREMALRVLKNAGYTVITSPNGYDALKLAKGEMKGVDLLVSDVIMPHMSGRELADKLAAIWPRTRVLFMSGFMDDAIVRHGISQETINFISKPFTAVQFTQRVREVLDKPHRI